MKYIKTFENFGGSATSKDVPWGVIKNFKIGDIVKFHTLKSDTICIISNISYYTEGYDKRGKLLTNVKNSQPIELSTIVNDKLIVFANTTDEYLGKESESVTKEEEDFKSKLDTIKYNL